MTGPGAEEEIQEYGQHYCECGDSKYWGDSKCFACTAEEEIVVAAKEDRRSGGLLSYLPPGFKLPEDYRDIPEVDGEPLYQKSPEADMVIRNVYINAKDDAALRQIAGQTGMTRSKLIRQAIQDYVILHNKTGTKI